MKTINVFNGIVENLSTLIGAARKDAKPEDVIKSEPWSVQGAMLENISMISKAISNGRTVDYGRIGYGLTFNRKNGIISSGVAFTHKGDIAYIEEIGNVKDIDAGEYLYLSITTECEDGEIEYFSKAKVSTSASGDGNTVLIGYADQDNEWHQAPTGFFMNGDKKLTVEKLIVNHLEILNGTFYKADVNEILVTGDDISFISSGESIVDTVEVKYNITSKALTSTSILIGSSVEATSAEIKTITNSPKITINTMRYSINVSGDDGDITFECDTFINYLKAKFILVNDITTINNCVANNTIIKSNIISNNAGNVTIVSDGVESVITAEKYEFSSIKNKIPVGTIIPYAGTSLPLEGGWAWFGPAGSSPMGMEFVGSNVIPKSDGGIADGVLAVGTELGVEEYVITMDQMANHSHDSRGNIEEVIKTSANGKTNVTRNLAGQTLVSSPDIDAPIGTPVVNTPRYSVFIRFIIKE